MDSNNLPKVPGADKHPLVHFTEEGLFHRKSVLVAILRIQGGSL